jgi:hypothetical protein
LWLAPQFSFTPQPKNMTKLHFTAIANAINKRVQDSNTRDGNESAVLAQLAGELADQFEQFNPQFNRSKFLAVALA